MGSKISFADVFMQNQNKVEGDQSADGICVIENSKLLRQVKSKISSIGLSIYRNDPMFSDTWVCAISADPDQTRSSLISVSTVCFSICIFLTKYPKVWPLFLNFRFFTAKFSHV